MSYQIESLSSKWVPYHTLSFLHNSREDEGKKGSSHFDESTPLYLLDWCSFFLMDCSLENYYFLFFLKVLEPQTTHNSSWGPKSIHTNGYLIMLGKHSFTKYYSLFMDGLTNACWSSCGIGKCLLLHNCTLNAHGGWNGKGVYAFLELHFFPPWHFTCSVLADALISKIFNVDI